MLYTEEIKSLIALAKSSAQDNRFRGILKKLSNTFGFDYNKPFVTSAIKGKFTARSVTVLLDKLTNGNTDNCTVALMFRDCGDWRVDAHAFSVCDGKFVPRYIPLRKYDGSIADYFWRLQEINDQRKRTDCLTYVIVQENNLLRQSRKVHKPDLVTRYDRKRSWSETFVWKESGRNEIISRIDHRVYVQYHGEKISNEHLDLSGYAVGMKRIDLLDRTKKLRAERQKSAYEETDCTPVIAKAKYELMSAAAVLKSHLNAYLDRVIAGDIPAVVSGELAEKFTAAAGELSRWRGLPSAVSCINRATVSDAGKLYPSVSSLERDLMEVTVFCNSVNKIDAPQESDRAAD